jgi:hypothetical protein
MRRDSAPARARRGTATFGGVWVQREIILAARARGFHLVTHEVLDALPELGELSVGLLHLLLRHTSAALTLNENASPEVRRDLESWFDGAVPDHLPEGRTTPVPGQGTGGSASAGSRTRVARLLEALMGVDSEQGLTGRRPK